MIDLEIAIAEDCPVDADRIRDRLEALIVDAITADLQRQLAAYDDPAAGERTTLAVRGNLRDGLEFDFIGTSLELVEIVRGQFAGYTPLSQGNLRVTVAGAALDQLRFAFSGSPELVEAVNRYLRDGPLAER
jgi:hypothetical protein